MTHIDLVDGGLQFLGITVSFIILYSVAKKSNKKTWICILYGVIGGFILYRIPILMLQSTYLQTSVPILIIKQLSGYLLIGAAVIILTIYNKRIS
jgi:hypothetical protein